MLLAQLVTVVLDVISLPLIHVLTNQLKDLLLVMLIKLLLLAQANSVKSPTHLKLLVSLLQIFVLKMIRQDVLTPLIVNTILLLLLLVLIKSLMPHARPLTLARLLVKLMQDANGTLGIVLMLPQRSAQLLTLLLIVGQPLNSALSLQLEHVPLNPSALFLLLLVRYLSLLLYFE